MVFHYIYKTMVLKHIKGWGKAADIHQPTLLSYTTQDYPLNLSTMHSTCMIPAKDGCLNCSTFPSLHPPTVILISPLFSMHKFRLGVE